MAGWPGGADWITPSRLLLRNEMIANLLQTDRIEPNSEIIQSSISSDMNATAMQSSENEPRVAIVRYAAENFKGPPIFTLIAIEDNNGKQRATWRSDRFHAKGGIDTEKFGRVDRQDLNWSIAKFILPDDVNYESLRVAWSNDHCCGPGGPDGGDRNLYIDWVSLDKKIFPASKGSQDTCRDGNGDKNPGSMYCSGWLDLKQFEEVKDELDLQSVVDNSDPRALQLERVAFNWADNLSPQNNWNDISIDLLNPRFKDIEIDAMRINIVINRADKGRRILMNIEDS